MSQQINLYEERLRPLRVWVSGRNVCIGAVLALALVTGVAVWANREAAKATEAAALLQKQVGEQQQQLTALSKASADRKVSSGLAAELDQTKVTLAERSDVMDTLQSRRYGNTTGFSALMWGFARQAQKDLWLTSFNVTQGGEEIEIRGRVLDAAGLPAYVQRLGNEPVFQGRRFAALEMLDKESNDDKQAQATSASGSALGVPAAAAATAAIVTTNAAPATTATAAAAPVAVKAPRFVEFALRSENASAAGKTESSGGPRGGRGL